MEESESNIVYEDDCEDVTRTCEHENCHNESGVNCDTCEHSQDNRDPRQSHRSQNGYDKETEEGYIVTRGNDGEVQFTCKMCEAVLPSQRSIKGHIVMKHQGSGHEYQLGQ